MNRYCVNCGEYFKPDRSARLYCSQRCYGDYKSKKLKGKRPLYMSGFSKGYTPANKGRKSKLNAECHQCKKSFYTKPSKGAKFCSQQCVFESKNLPNKTIRKVRQDIRRLVAYRNWRKAVITRDGGRCQKCGNRYSLDVDHFPKTLDGLVREFNIKSSFETISISAFWDIGNGRILCKKCHHKEKTSTNYKVTVRNSVVCVTGGAGMIGSHLVDELLKRGNKVFVIDNLSAGERNYVSPQADFEWFDIRHDYERLARLFEDKGVKYVFHLASLPFIPGCFGDPQPFFDVNARGTMNLLLACEQAEVKKVLVYSSAEIYGTKTEPIKEGDKLNAQSTYGVAKMAAESLSKMRFVEAGLSVVINRQFNVFSWRARHPYIIPELINQLTKGSTVHLGNIYAYRDFLYIDDAVNMAIELLEKGIPGEEYNIGDEKCIQIKELAKLVGKLLGHKKINIKVDKNRLRPWDIAKLQSDNTKLYNTILYRPKFTLEEGLKEVIKKYKQNGNRWDFN